MSRNQEPEFANGTVYIEWGSHPYQNTDPRSPTLSPELPTNAESPTNEIQMADSTMVI